MNNKFVILASFLAALLCHLALFNLLTFVFLIDPVEHKPKFFFLGSILNQNDVRLISAKEHIPASTAMHKKFNSRKSSLRAMDPKLIDQTKNPFAIGTIKKPLVPQAVDSQKKAVIKATFEIRPKKNMSEKVEIQHGLDQELNIPSYRPLRFRSP